MSDAPAPIRHAVILAHPSPRSFDAAIAQAYCEAVCDCGQQALVRDLYALGFDPVLRDEERPRRTGMALSSDVSQDRGDRQLRHLRAGLSDLVRHAAGDAEGLYRSRLGAGATPHQIQDRAAKGVLTGRHTLSITTSGAREVWLDEQGQVESLRSLSTRYLLNAFAMKSCEHLHFGGIVEGLSEPFADQYLYEVQERARKLCARLAAERRSGAAPSSVGDGS